MPGNGNGVVRPVGYRAYAAPSDTASLACTARAFLGEHADLLSDLEAVRAFQVALTQEVSAATRVTDAAFLVPDDCGIDSDDSRLMFTLDSGLVIVLPARKQDRLRGAGEANGTTGKPDRNDGQAGVIWK
ncbi:hypothetical protein OKW50_000097 [Paraburkholderia youngii]|uniref:hypothetical protein n=1 Tax=Paraburkholderia youngii TaxID=2782701 RepID=UPI003D1F2FED